MRGVGRTSGAVTIVNALPTGVGCAVAVSLPVRADLELGRSGASGHHRIRIDHSADTPLVRETLRSGLDRFAPGETFTGELRIHSEVPIARGLKSSSAVGGAVLAAVSDALRQNRSPPDLARLAAEVSQEIGLSATGAYDDCLASLQGGLVLTNNATRTALQVPEFDSTLEVVVWVPAQPHAPSVEFLPRFRTHSARGAEAVRAARGGAWGEAVRLNTEIVEEVMGYPYADLRERLGRAGATMTGVSGMGPALAAFVRPEFVSGVQAHLPAEGAEILHVKLRTGGRFTSEES